jgi:hypothetical protein
MRSIVLTTLLFSFLATVQAQSQISFVESFSNVSESSGIIEVELIISEPVSDDAQISVEVIAPSTANETHFTFLSETLNFAAGSSGVISLSIPILDNFSEDPEVFFTLSLSNPFNCAIGSGKTHFVFIQDDENFVISPSNSVSLDFLNSYTVDAGGSAEIVAYDPTSQHLFVLNSIAARVNVLDFHDPSNITEIGFIDMSSYGIGATSVAVSNGLVAATVQGAEYGPGSVVFFDVDGQFINALQVGVLPDMVVFTPNGNSVLIANEGEPAFDYVFDPEGSISRIDINGDVSSLSQEDVITIDFHDFDYQKDALISAGVRIFGLNSTVSQDLEPEYITVSLQENNALAELDLATNEITSIVPLGVKDHSLPENVIDVSDRNDDVFLANWNIKGMYMPDAIANYTVGGTTFIVTANEGDQREYGVIDEDVQVKSGSYVLDPVAFPAGDLIKKDQLLGRLAVSPYSGDTDGDGDFDEIHAFGARSFSVWNSETHELVYDSGSDFERITSLDSEFGGLFNANNTSNGLKNRSDNKGPEPEGVTISQIGGRFYAFITLERIGGVMTYDITNPGSPIFVDYDNSRTIDGVGGDLGPEGIIYISSNQSPIGLGLVVVANEISSTISVFTVANNTACFADFDNSGIVDSGDFLILLGSYGCAIDCGDADLTEDGQITIDDVLFFLGAIGALCEGVLGAN